MITQPHNVLIPQTSSYSTRPDERKTSHFKYSNGDSYRGEILGGARDGQGSYTYKDGREYVGGWRNNQFHGKGTITYPNGKKYTCDYDNGKIVYPVVIDFPNGDVYEGHVNGVKIDGRGKLYRKADRAMYEGEWKDQKHHGKGSLVTFDAEGNESERYEGDWESGLKHGHGTLHAADGTIYEGDWKSNCMEGAGLMLYPNGNSYRGDFHKGKRHGMGRLNYKDGRFYDGQWRNNVAFGTGTFQYRNGDKYTGGWNITKKQGKGKLEFANGDSYEGDWENGEATGEGVFTFANQDQFSGHFEKGVPHGKGTLVTAYRVTFSGVWSGLRGRGEIIFDDGTDRAFIPRARWNRRTDGLMTYTIPERKDFKGGTGQAEVKAKAKGVDVAGNVQPMSTAAAAAVLAPAQSSAAPSPNPSPILGDKGAAVSGGGRGEAASPSPSPAAVPAPSTTPATAASAPPSSNPARPAVAPSPSGGGGGISVAEPAAVGPVQNGVLELANDADEFNSVELDEINNEEEEERRRKEEEEARKIFHTVDYQITPLSVIDESLLSGGVKIGQGGFGEVYKGFYTGAVVAWKTLNTSVDQDVMKDFLREASMMNQCRHPNVVHFYGYTPPPKMRIVMEYANRGTLHSYIHEQKGKLDVLTLVEFAQQIASGMTYLHSQHIIHKDLKPLNVMMNEESTGHFRLLITDFGLSKITHHSHTLVLHKGTPQYTPPEGYSDCKVDEKLDVFGFGVMLWEMWKREIPFRGLNNAQMMAAICGKQRPPLPRYPPAMEDTLGNFSRLMQQCWADTPAERPSFKECLLVLKLIKNKVLLQVKGK